MHIGNNITQTICYAILTLTFSNADLMSFLSLKDRVLKNQHNSTPLIYLHGVVLS